MRRVQLLDYDAGPVLDTIQGLLVKALTELENLKTKFGEIQDEWRRST